MKKIYLLIISIFQFGYIFAQAGDRVGEDRISLDLKSDLILTIAVFGSVILWGIIMYIRSWFSNNRELSNNKVLLIYIISLIIMWIVAIAIVRL
jgi:hypothetical protein